MLQKALSEIAANEAEGTVISVVVNDGIESTGQWLIAVISIPLYLYFILGIQDVNYIIRYGHWQVSEVEVTHSSQALIADNAGRQAQLGRT